MSSDLLFRQPPGTPDLLFGEVENFADTELYLAGVLPPLRGAVEVGYRFPASVVGALAGFTGAAQARYVSETDRPLVGRTVSAYQEAAAVEVGSEERHERGRHTPSGAETAWAPAVGAHASTSPAHREAERDRRPSLRARHQDATGLSVPSLVARHQDAYRDRRLGLAAAYQKAAAVRVAAETDWQDRYRDRRPGREGRWTRAKRRWATYENDYGAALALGRRWGARYQEAMRPPAGVSVPAVVVPPPFNPCYLPDPDLVFSLAFGASAALLFRCETHPDPQPPATTIVPVRSVYVMNNSIALRRVADGLQIPVRGFSMQIDADSWTWTWSATLPYAAASLLQPSGVDPVEVFVTVNGVDYRMLVERLATDRSFGDYSLKVSGRGRNAALADPYAPRLSFSAAADRTAQQLMLDALTDNGVSLGWTVEFGLEDWLVPGGTWAHQGTWLSAVRAIAEAAGGYVQPHRVNQTLRVLPRYPAAPWAWGSLTPDFELPAAVTVQEAIEFIEKPLYNRVFVNGERNGRTVRVTRAGTAGDAVAPTVVDPLITSVIAGRQRGLGVLSDVGRQAAVSLRLPVLSETGVIVPGALVRYLDGVTPRLGVVRTASVSGDVQLRQTLGIETHVAP